MLAPQTEARTCRPPIAATAAVVIVAALCGCGASGGHNAGSISSSTPTTPTATPTPKSARADRRRAGARHVSQASPTQPASPAALGRPTKTSGCHVRGQLPDPACTPGAVFPNATVAAICQSGYTRRVRNVLPSTKDAVYASYGITSHTARQYEIDHLVPLEVGGNNTRANLWPEITPGFGEKDTVENELHAAVCSGRMALRTAQARIARDWRHAGVDVTLTSYDPLPPASLPPISRAGSSPTTAAPDFCATHRCIASFSTGRGSIVQCADGQYSHSGGLPGVCSRHGGAR